MRFHAFKGATAWEAQIGPFWVQWPFLKYIRFRCWPRFGIESNQDEVMKQYSIVGQKHRGLDPYLTGTLPGTPVVLVREPNNKFDPNAVMVWIDGKHVGYIPSKDAAALAPFIDQTGMPWQEPVKMANDGITGRIISHPRSVSAVFARSPNSSYPMCQLSE